MMSTQSKELKDRIHAKRKELEAELHRLKADASEGTRERAEKLEQKIKEVDRAIEDGFENLKSDTIEQLSDWLKDDDRR